MGTTRWAKGKLAVAGAVTGSLLSLALLAQETAPTKPGGANLQHGRALYLMHCQSCHGPDGDNLVCQDIIPLAGLSRRPRVDLVRGVTSPSYFFRGMSYEGEDARDLTAFLLRLKGDKGFDDPGLRCPPRLLSKRYGLFDYYRVIDIRDRAAYAKGHIPNAERWPAAEERGEPQPGTADLVRKKLGRLAVRPTMSIVIYDDTVTPAAARLWWNLVRAGHKNVSILDGGLRGWADEDSYLTTVVTPLVPTNYVFSEGTVVPPVRGNRDYPLLHLRAGLPQPSSGVFDWERTVVDGQLRTAAQIREYLQGSDIKFPGAYRVEGSDAEASLLVYLLRLLGHEETYYDSASKLLIAGNSEQLTRAPHTP